MKKACYCYTFYNENHRLSTCIYPVIRKIYLLKNILAYCGHSPMITDDDDDGDMMRAQWLRWGGEVGWWCWHCDAV